MQQDVDRPKPRGLLSVDGEIERDRRLRHGPVEPECVRRINEPRHAVDACEVFDVSEVVGEEAAADKGEIESREQRDESRPARGHCRLFDL
jgi:hypothetical protein